MATFIKGGIPVQDLYDAINEVTGMTSSGSQGTITIGNSKNPVEIGNTGPAGGGFVKLNSNGAQVLIGSNGVNQIVIRNGELSIPGLTPSSINYNQLFSFIPQNFTSKSGNTVHYTCSGMSSDYNCSPIWFNRTGNTGNDDLAADFLSLLNESQIRTGENEIIVTFPSTPPSSATQISYAFYLLRV